MLHSKLFLSILTLVTCLNLVVNAQNKSASISITVVGQKDSLVTLSTTDLLSMDTLLLDSEKLNNEGKASLKADLQRPLFMTVQFGKTFVPVLMEPGMQLDIRFDEKNPKQKLSLSGDGAEAARALADYEKVRRNYDNLNGKSSHNADENDFVKRGIGLQNKLTAIYQNLVKKCTLPAASMHLLAEYKDATIKFFYNNYTVFKYKGVTDPAMPASIKKIESMKLSADTATLFSNMYPHGLNLNMELLFKIHARIGDMMGKPPYDSTSTLDWVEIADRELVKMDYPPHLKDFFRIKNLAYWVQSSGISPAMRTLYDEMSADPAQKQFLRGLNKGFAVWEPLQPGKPAPNFTGITPEGKSISLSDLKGKLVYIDVWATWCKPCIGEFPASKKLLKEFEKNEEIVFLFVSIDDNVEKWKKMLPEERVPKGVQMQQPQNDQADAIWQNYHLAGIPRYILVNKDGTMLETHAPRPSSGKVAELLRKHI